MTLARLVVRHARHAVGRAPRAWHVAPELREHGAGCPFGDRRDVGLVEDRVVARCQRHDDRVETGVEVVGVEPFPGGTAAPARSSPSRR